MMPAMLQPRMTMARTLKLYKLPDKPKTPGIRALEKKDIPQASLAAMLHLHQLLLACLLQCHVMPIQLLHHCRWRCLQDPV